MLCHVLCAFFGGTRTVYAYGYGRPSNSSSTSRYGSDSTTAYVTAPTLYASGSLYHYYSHSPGWDWWNSSASWSWSSSSNRVSVRNTTRRYTSCVYSTIRNRSRGTQDTQRCRTPTYYNSLYAVNGNRIDNNGGYNGTGAYSSFTIYGR